MLGSGLDVMYPRENARLADEIVKNGALVSEHPLGTRPDAQNFPRRNRIMSGMTLGTVVVEAPERSGALLTARHALDETESQVIRYVTYDPIHIDEIIRSSGQAISTVSSTLAMMELKGLIKQVGGMNYIRLKEVPAEYQTVV